MKEPASLVAALLLFVFACSGDKTGGNGNQLAIERTVSGDTTVIKIVGDIEPSAELRLVEVWREGDPDGDEDTSFGYVHSIAVTETEDVYVFEGTVPQFRHYSADGSLIRILSRKGSGPGEYTRSNGISVLKDGRLVLWDGGGSRINIYSAADSFIEQWRPPVQGFGTGSNFLRSMMDGRIAVRAFVRDSTLPREALGRIAWFMFSPDGTMGDTVFQPTAQKQPPRLFAQKDGSTSTNNVPFMVGESATLHPEGYLIIADGESYNISYVRNQSPIRIERTTKPVPISEEERSQSKEQATWQMRQVDPAWTWNGPEVPRNKAPISSVFIADDGQILVSVSTPSEPYQRDTPRVEEGRQPQPVVNFRAPLAYEVFDQDGNFNGRFTLPHGNRLYVLKGRDAWGTVTDSLDIPYIVRWRLEDPLK